MYLQYRESLAFWKHFNTFMYQLRLVDFFKFQIITVYNFSTLQISFHKNKLSTLIKVKILIFSYFTKQITFFHIF